MPGADHVPDPDVRDAEGDQGGRIFAPRAADWWIGTEPISDLMAANIAAKGAGFRHGHARALSGCAAGGWL